MDNQKIFDMIEGWGYHLMPASHGACPGYSGLVVAIRKEPTGEHFDPESICLHVCREGGHTVCTTLNWSTPLKKNRHVCPGALTLRDRYDKRVDFFTFGGSIEVVTQPGEFIYIIRSSAPILKLTERDETNCDHMAEEAKGLLAKVAERWAEQQGSGFEERMAQVDPLALYVAVLNNILTRYGRTPALQELYRDFYEALQEEKEWLIQQGGWPDETPPVDELVLSGA